MSHSRVPAQLAAAGAARRRLLCQIRPAIALLPWRRAPVHRGGPANWADVWNSGVARWSDRHHPTTTTKAPQISIAGYGTRPCLTLIQPIPTRTTAASRLWIARLYSSQPKEPDKPTTPSSDGLHAQPPPPPSPPPPHAWTYHLPPGTSRYFYLPSFSHLPHRPSKEELLAAATGFWHRLRIRFKWASIRSMRPWNADEWGAFVSWVFLGHIVWILAGTTTFFSLLILSINTVFAQGGFFRGLVIYPNSRDTPLTIQQKRWRPGSATTLPSRRA